MIPELGHFALILALCLALVQATFPLIGSLNRTPSWVALARPLAWGQFAFLALSFAALVQAFLGNDFSVLYVAQHGNTQLPLMYKISAVWGAHEGSLLLWSLILAGWMVAVAMFSRNLPQEMVARVLSVMGMVSIGFLSFMLFTSNPFDRVFPAPLEGGELNPLLQDPGLAIHPPMLYMGYVGMSVAFSFAIAALLGGKMDAAWARWTVWRRHWGSASGSRNFPSGVSLSSRRASHPSSASDSAIRKKTPTAAQRAHPHSRMLISAITNGASAAFDLGDAHLGHPAEGLGGLVQIMEFGRWR